MEHLAPLKQSPAVEPATLLNIDDGGLKHTASLSQLEELDIRSTAVTDSGLEIIEGFKQLRQLDVTDTGITKAGVETLRRALPRCRILSD